MGRLEEELARLERQVRGGEATPEVLVRLAQAYLRADRPGAAGDAFARARDALSAASPLVRDGAGEVAGLHPLWEEVREGLTLAEERAGLAARDERRRALVARLERGELTRAEHEELIGLEVADRLPIHPQVPACPACEGPVAATAEGGVACARSGQDGDLCRHTDARGLFACTGCGLVVRAWSERKLRPDPKEPPLVRPGKARCPFCSGGVVDWGKHFLRCPRARPADFPRCERCRRRGFHRRALQCPRCQARVTELECAEPISKARRG